MEVLQRNSIWRGVEAGDPLSPYLFLLATKGLHVMMSSLVDHNLFAGYQVGSFGSLAIPHFQFNDDTLLLGRKNWVNVRALRAILILFEALSGLQVNFHKKLVSWS